MLVEVQPVSLADMGDMVFWQTVVETFRDPVENQVRIERQITIRIAPRPAPMPPPNMLVELPRQPVPRRQVERSMGNCVPISGIAGVQASSGNQMTLFIARISGWCAPRWNGRARPAAFIRGFTSNAPPMGSFASIATPCCRAAGPIASSHRLRQLVPQD